jgi:hypothetical protein
MAEPPERYPGQGQYLARQHWILVRAGTGTGFHHEHVFRLVSTNREKIGDVLLLFTSEAVAGSVAAEWGRRGFELEICTLATADELTDLLTELKDRGVTHVIIDPAPGSGSDTYRPIAQVILDFQLSE